MKIECFKFVKCLYQIMYLCIIYNIIKLQLESLYGKLDLKI